MVERGTFESGAEFSDCGQYRYALWRRWDWQGYAQQVAFVGLNPSTADESEDDPTIRRCIGFAKSWGFGGLLMLNAYAFRATNPKVMKAAADPIGPGNDQAALSTPIRQRLVVAAWGSHCGRDREMRVCQLLWRVECLGRTKSGRPRHPLYLYYSRQWDGWAWVPGPFVAGVSGERWVGMGSLVHLSPEFRVRVKAWVETNKVRSRCGVGRRKKPRSGVA